jgi:hypothetical protein
VRALSVARTAQKDDRARIGTDAPSGVESGSIVSSVAGASNAIVVS